MRCLRCTEEAEDTHHLLLQCPWSTEVWSAQKDECGLSLGSLQFNDWCEHLSIPEGLSRSVRCIIFVDYTSLSTQPGKFGNKEKTGHSMEKGLRLQLSVKGYVHMPWKD